MRTGTISVSTPGRPARSSPGVDVGCEYQGRSARASVREVCLVGVAARPASWAVAVGDHVTWSGRVYRVESTQDAPPGCGYVHLGPCDDGAPATASV